MCGLNWQNCVKHRPIEVQSKADPTNISLVHRSKAISASGSAAKLDKLEPHNASRIILSPGLAQRFPHLVGAPIGISSTLLTSVSTVMSTRVCNSTIHTELANDEPPADEQDKGDKSPESVLAASSPNYP